MKRNLFVGAIAGAAFAVACPAPSVADFCELSWDVPCCPIPGTNIGKAEVVLTICNCTDQPTEYEFIMKSPVAGVMFDPPFGIVGLAPGDCVDIPITVYCPPFDPANPNEGVPIFANVLNLATGAQFECPGLVRAVQNFKVTPSDPVIVGTFTPDGATNATLVVTNMSADQQSLMLSFQTMGPILPMEPREVAVAPGGTTTVAIKICHEGGPPGGANITEGFGPPSVFTAAVLILWDDDGDGAPEVNSSVGLRFEGVACPGDLNGDGVVNGADLANLLANWGLCN